jgi:YD repeat-containing protein
VAWHPASLCTNPDGCYITSAYSYSAAHPHAVTTAGPFGFGYDANGNMTSVGGQFTTWDAENRPTSIQRVSGSETYAYDADGERITR